VPTATRYLANVAAQSTARAASLATTMLVFALAARRLGPAGFGEFSYIMAYAALLGVFAEAGTTAILARELALRRGSPQLAAFFGTFLLLRLGLGIAVAALGVAFLLAAGVTDRMLLTASLVAPVAAARFFEPVFQVFDEPWRSAPVALVAGTLYLAGSAGALAGAESPLPWVVVSWGAAGLLYLVLALRACRDLVPLRLAWDGVIARGTFALALPLALATILAVVNSRVGLLLLARLGTPEAVGQLGAAAKLVELGTIVATTLSTPLLPILVSARARPDGLRGTAQRIFVIILVCGLPSVILLRHFAPFALTLAFGPAFREAESVARILFWQLALIPLSLIASAVMLAAGSIRFASWSGALAVAVNVGIGLWLVPSMGADGSAIAAALAELTLLCVALFFMFRELGPALAPVPTAKIAALNLGFALLFDHPLFASDAVNAAAALLLYGGLIFLAGVVSPAELRALLTSPAREAAE
jgi:O-antigen/teichoic acid export membrane protein